MAVSHLHYSNSNSNILSTTLIDYRFILYMNDILIIQLIPSHITRCEQRRPPPPTKTMRYSRLKALSHFVGGCREIPVMHVIDYRFTYLLCWGIITLSVHSLHPSSCNLLRKHTSKPLLSSPLRGATTNHDNKKNYDDGGGGGGGGGGDIDDGGGGDDNAENHERRWLNHGLLFSSFSDGLSQNTRAKTFLGEGLAKGLLLDRCADAENKLENAVLASPCNGPDVSLMEALNDIDTVLEKVKHHPDPMSLLPSSSSAPLELRFVYIPTALYALRPDSNNTPGKQRQRARADGKQRRNRIINFLKAEVIPESCAVRAVTLDLDDGSVKQPECTLNSGPSFPVNGKEALSDWKPHLVYIEGGNTFWLTHCVEKGDWGHLLTNVLTNPATVYCGSSAGAILVGQRIETACWKGWDDPRVVPGRENHQSWEGVLGLGLVGDASFFPHMNDSWNDLVEEKQQTLSHVECLNEEHVVCVRGPERTRLLAAGTPVNILDAQVQAKK